MKMPMWALIAGVLIIYLIVMDWHDEQASHAPAPVPVAAAAVPSPPFNGNNDRELIVAVATTYGVPAGLLYGIWQKESGGLRGGWGSRGSWLRAGDLARPGSRCYSEYSSERCERWWRGLTAICNQRRNGTPICDPNEVRTSYAFAMGPMQLLPTSLVTGADGSMSWNAEVAVDFDGDGVVDPHSLPDAMAMAARHVRRHYDQRAPSMGENDAWIWAANRYYGSQTAGYYEGSGRRLGIQDHWRQWCRITGMCDSGIAVASN